MRSVARRKRRAASTSSGAGALAAGRSAAACSARYAFARASLPSRSRSSRRAISAAVVVRHVLALDRELGQARRAERHAPVHPDPAVVRGAAGRRAPPARAPRSGGRARRRSAAGRRSRRRGRGRPDRRRRRRATVCTASGAKWRARRATVVGREGDLEVAGVVEEGGAVGHLGLRDASRSLGAQWTPRKSQFGWICDTTPATMWIRLSGERLALPAGLRARCAPRSSSGGWRRARGCPRRASSRASSASRATPCSRPTSSSWPRATPRRARGVGNVRGRDAARGPRAASRGRERRAATRGAGAGAGAGARALRRARAARTLAAAPRDLAGAVPRRRLPLRLPLRRARLRRPPARDLVAAAPRGARRRASAAQLAYGAPGGAPELRDALAGYLRARARRALRARRRSLVVNGTQQAIDLAARVLVDPGDARRARGAALHRASRSRSRAHGAEIVPRRRSTTTASSRARSRTRRRCRGVLRDAVAPVPDRRRAAARAPARAPRVGERARRVRARGRLRRRVPLRRAADRVPAGARPQRARALRRARTSKLLFPALRIGWLVVPPALRARCSSTRRRSPTPAPRRSSSSCSPTSSRGATSSATCAARACATPRAARRCSRRSSASSAATRRCSARARASTCVLSIPRRPMRARVRELRERVRRARRRHLPDRALLRRAPAAARRVPARLRGARRDGDRGGRAPAPPALAEVFEGSVTFSAPALDV